MSEPKMRHAWLRALGSDDLPTQLVLDDGTYRHLRTYKHDFFAATGLYEGPSGRAILKVGRIKRFLGLPMIWLGGWLARREYRIYDVMDDLAGVPRCMGLWSRTGFVHEFAPGHPLQRYEQVSDVFFPQLEALLDRLHERGLAYADLEKRENILVGEDGRPYLIDFQISWYWPAQGEGQSRWVPGFLGRYILRKLQQADRYHLLKHRRRHRPDTMTEEEIATSYRTGVFIVLHRRLFRPLTLCRRAILKALTGRSRSAKQDGAEFVNTP